jgi:hypothetical protein
MLDQAQNSVEAVRRVSEYSFCPGLAHVIAAHGLAGEGYKNAIKTQAAS